MFVVDWSLKNCKWKRPQECLLPIKLWKSESEKGLKNVCCRSNFEKVKVKKCKWKRPEECLLPIKLWKNESEKGLKNVCCRSNWESCNSPSYPTRSEPLKIFPKWLNVNEICLSTETYICKCFWYEYLSVHILHVSVWALEEWEG